MGKGRQEQMEKMETTDPVGAAVFGYLSQCRVNGAPDSDDEVCAAVSDLVGCRPEQVMLFRAPGQFGVSVEWPPGAHRRAWLMKY